MKLVKFSTDNLLKQYEVFIDSFEISLLCCSVNNYLSKREAEAKKDSHVLQSELNMLESLLDTLRLYRDL